MKIARQTLIKYGAWLALGAFSGVLLHLLVIYFDSFFVKGPVEIDMQKSFLQTAFTFPFLPILLIEIISGAVVFVLWARMRLALKRAFSIDLQRKSYEDQVKSQQKLMGILAANISAQNSIILKKLNFRKSKGQQVSESVEQASLNIGKILSVLSEVSFVEPYLDKEKRTDLVDVLEERINAIVHEDSM